MPTVHRVSFLSTGDTVVKGSYLLSDILFPDIKKPDKLEEIAFKAQIRTPFEDGSVSSSSKATRMRKRFLLAWSERYAIPNSDKEELFTFFATYSGKTFLWRNPQDKNWYSVRFSSDKLKFAVAALIGFGYWTGSVELEEA